MKPKIALFLHQPKCSAESGNGIIAALGDHYKFKIFTKYKIPNGFFRDVDIIAVPGGIGDASSFYSLFAENRRAIRNYMKRGGRYLGICMGAYWAGSNYLNILDNIDCVQYITRPNTDTRRPHAKALDIKWRGKKEKMFFYDGCSIIGDGEFENVATYANGDTMAGYQGRIGLIGCHPESEKTWYQQYPYLLPDWHEGRQHRLLKRFVDNLMKR